MSHTLCLTLAQINPTVGDLAGNAQKILDIWKDYEDKTDLVVFPALALTGAPLNDLAQNEAFLQAVDAQVREICITGNNFGAAVWIPTLWRDDQSRKLDAVLHIEKGAIKAAHFDSATPVPIGFRGTRLGLLVGENTRHETAAGQLKDAGADLLIYLDAQPFRSKQGINPLRQTAQKCVEKTGLNLIAMNLTGGQDECVFDGRSFVISKDASVLYTAPAFERGIFDVTFSGAGTNRGEVSVISEGNTADSSPEDLTALTYQALVIGLRDYAHKNGFQSAVLGMSGGMDSALCAAIAVDALGKENLHCVMLPSEFTSQGSLDDAQACAGMLGVKYDIIPIHDAVSTFENLIPGGLSGLAHENAQSRTRGLILMTLSNISGGLLLATGNKSEGSVGYCTLYGDTNGGFNCLKDIYKTDVYKLAAWRNEQGTVIPQSILDKPPSAELSEGQKDSDSIPPYDILDDMLRVLVDYDDVDWDTASEDLKNLYARCLERPEDMQHVARLINISEYKRFQAAPGPQLSERSSGRPRTYPVTNGFTQTFEPRKKAQRCA